MITGRLNPAPRVIPPPPLPLLLPRPLYPSPEPTGPVPSPLPSRPSPVPLPVTFFSLARGRSRSMSSPFRNECPMAETAIHYNTSISTALLRPNTTFIMPSSAIIPSLLLFLHCCYTFIAAIPSLLLFLHCCYSFIARDEIPAALPVKNRQRNTGFSSRSCAMKRVSFLRVYATADVTGTA